MRTRKRSLRTGVPALVVGGVLALAGCGDVDQQDITNLLDKAGKAREQFDEEYGEDLDELFDELQQAAEDQAAVEESRQWGTRPEPPPYTPSTEDTVVTDQGAVERSVYPKEAYDDIVAHYADEMGIDVEGQGGAGEQGTTLDDDEGTHVVVDNTGSDSVEVTVFYPRP